ncbi:MAG: protein-L-isoaspartate(D-aspartate) O-methyltransferase [Patescibacteria group bacterium]
MNSLINQLIKDGYLKTEKVINAFSEIGRVEFVPEEMELQAEANVALPIGCGQMISQPLTVAFMLELLDPSPGQKILDVGSGSGWTTALLSHIVGEKGKVVAVERIKKLCDLGQENVEKFGYVSRGIAQFHLGDGSKGCPEEAPFDRILVSAETDKIPEDLKNQLKVGGKMVIPTKNSLYYLEKKDEEKFYEEEFSGFSFVPLIID